MLQEHAAALPSGKSGALATFLGSMRDVNEGDAVRAMILEHYPAMTERYLKDLEQRAAQRWDLLSSLIVHRTGELRPGDDIVFVAVWAAHRAHAFEACRWLMEELKHNAPFWKQEILADGSQRWVTQNTPGAVADTLVRPDFCQPQ